MFTSGDVRVTSAKGVVRELKTGEGVESGETVQTGKGRVQLRMVDGALMALGERTTLLAGAASSANDDDNSEFAAAAAAAVKSDCSKK